MRWQLCKIFGKLPSDPMFDEMTEWDLLWMAEMIRQDDKDDFEKQKSFTDYLAAFINPEALRKSMDAENNTVKVSDEDFSKTLEMLNKQDEPK